MQNQPGSWGSRIARAMLLLLALAIGARVVYELLTPLVPLALALLIISGLWLFVLAILRR